MENRMEETILQEINTLENKRQALNLYITLTGAIDCACFFLSLSFSLSRMNQIMILIILLIINYLVIYNATETIKIINAEVTKCENRIKEICDK